MTGLTSEIEKKPPFSDERGHCGRIANIGKIDSYAVANVMNIKGVAAVFWNEAVDQRHLRTEIDQAAGEGRPDEAQAAGNQNVRSDENVWIPSHQGIVGRRRKDFL